MIFSYFFVGFFFSSLLFIVCFGRFFLQGAIGRTLRGNQGWVGTYSHVFEAAPLGTRCWRTGRSKYWSASQALLTVYKEEEKGRIREHISIISSTSKDFPFPCSAKPLRNQCTQILQDEINDASNLSNRTQWVKHDMARRRLQEKKRNTHQWMRRLDASHNCLITC